MVHVHPEAEPLAHLLPVLDVTEDGLAAQTVELLDAVALDIRFAFEAELFLYLDLYGQTVAVPAALALDPVTLHGLVPGDEVLESPRKRVVEPRPAVGRRRPLIEHEGPVLRPAVHRLLESVHLLPKTKDLLLEPREIYLRADLIELHAADLLVQKLPPPGRSVAPP